MNKLKYKKICNYYNKLLKKYHNISFKAHTDCRLYFVTYLKFLRDSIILKTTPIDQREDKILAALCFAINEYELYNTCIENYYIVSNNSVKVKDDKMTSEVAQNLYQIERNLHWNNFWYTVKAHIEDWGVNSEITF